MAAKGVLVVFTNPAEGADEDAFNDWYTNVHAPDIIKQGVAISFKRFRCSDVALLPGIPVPAKYGVIYQIHAETEDQVKAGADALAAALARGEVDISPTLDMTTPQAAFMLPITDEISL